MFTFASNKTKTYDGVPNIWKPPSEILSNGFTPHSSTTTGSPMVAQWFNYLFNAITEAFPVFYNVSGTSITIAPNANRTRRYTYWRVQIIPTGNTTAVHKTFFVDTSSVSSTNTAGHQINVQSNGNFEVTNVQLGWKLILEPLGYGE